jgi:hypothetical protein
MRSYYLSATAGPPPTLRFLVVLRKAEYKDWREGIDAENTVKELAVVKTDTPFEWNGQTANDAVSLEVVRKMHDGRYLLHVLLT